MGDFNNTVAASQQHVTNNPMYMSSGVIPVFIAVEGYTRGYIWTVNAENSALFKRTLYDIW